MACVQFLSILFLHHFRRSLVPARNASRSDAGGTPTELPESLLRYVIRTLESVTLRDASAENCGL
jgi:hypothetical protein